MTDVLALLVAERDRLQGAINILTAPSGPPPAPEPPAPITLVLGRRSGARVGRTFSPAQREAQKLKMKEYWRKRKRREARQTAKR